MAVNSSCFGNHELGVRLIVHTMPRSPVPTSKMGVPGLALDVVGVQPTQLGRRVHVLAVWAGPGWCWWKFQTALVHPVLHAALLSPGCARQAWSCWQLSHTALLHCGHMEARSTHPAESPQSTQARAMDPHSIARSPVRSPSGLTHTSQRSCMAGMAGNYTLLRDRVGQVQVLSKNISAEQLGASIPNQLSRCSVALQAIECHQMTAAHWIDLRTVIVAFISARVLVELGLLE